MKVKIRKAIAFNGDDDDFILAFIDNKIYAMLVDGMSTRSGMKVKAIYHGDCK